MSLPEEHSQEPDIEFSRLYHAHHSRHQQDLPFWNSLAREFGSPVLELGCGTGRVLMPLAQTGCEVVGVDNDPAMLAVLQEYLDPALLPRVRFVQADFTQMELAERFPLIILPCNTLSTLAAKERAALMHRVAAHLQAGGLFVASLPNPALLKQLPAYGEPELEEVFPHPLDGKPVHVFSSWNRTVQGVTITWEYAHENPDGTTRLVRREVHHWRASLQSYLDELRSAGLESISLYGDFNRTPYHKTSDELILLARQASPISTQ